MLRSNWFSHPWVQGECSERLKAFEKFLKSISEMNNLKIKTFGEMCNLNIND